MGNVSFDVMGVSYTLSDGMVRGVQWSELRAVELVTTDSGPFAGDVFWVLHGTESPMLVPQSAAGSDALLVRLQELPGFDNEAVIKAMSCADNKRFSCWSMPDDEPGAAVSGEACA